MNSLDNFKPKSFWERPEGTTGMLFGVLIAGGAGYLLYKLLPYIINILENTLHAVLLFVAVGVVLYVLLDPKFRNLVWFMYKSIMRFITGMFVQIDPIGILKTYIESLQDNLSKMDKQISSLRGQMRKLKDIMNLNEKTMNDSLAMASQAREKGKQAQMVLKSRKAGRLQESNMKLGDLYKKMEILYRVLSKMYENSEILLEDIKDQVEVKKMERDAIRASHSAMRSALNIISGDKDKRMMFDQAMESIADDVSRKVGEMERFMELSANFMDSIDLQNGVYEEKGVEMLEKWEKEGISFLLGDQKDLLIEQGNNSRMSIDLDAPNPSQRPGNNNNNSNQYTKLFD
jgi:predicted  nucleic acid-binding Zn-ribbon protein